MSAATPIPAPRTPSDLCAAFAAELRPYLPMLDVMPEPRVLGPSYFVTFARINDRQATLLWRVSITTRGELLSCDIDSLTVGGLELPVDLVTDDEREFAEEWAMRNADEFPNEGDG